MALFAADEITLSPDAISDQEPPASLSFTRDTAREQKVASFFLGQNIVQEDQGGGIITYTGSAGTATFRSNGSFDIKGTLSSDDVESLCRKFCQDFSYDEPVLLLDDSGFGGGKAIYLHNKLPVFNCTVTFTLENGVLTSTSGTLLPEEGSLFSETTEPLTASAALTTFQKTRREGSVVCSAVTEMYPCYELQSSTASTMSLVPAWCIVTDIANYYVNCISGVVTSG